MEFDADPRLKAQIENLAVDLGRIPTPAEVRSFLKARGTTGSQTLAARITPRSPIANEGLGVAPVAPAAEVPGQAEAEPVAKEDLVAGDDWWSDVADFGDSDAGPVAGAAPVESNDEVGEVIAALLADWERTGALDGAAVERAMGHRRLRAEERAAVAVALRAAGVEVAWILPRVGAATHADSQRIRSGDALSSYMASLRGRRLLNAEDEVRLGRLVQRGQAAEDELVRRASELDRITRRELEREVQRGRDARDRFVESNLRLVAAQARNYLDPEGGLEYLDLIQLGNIGLIRAVEKFDPEMGTKFSTYATWWIKQSITRGIADTGRLVRLPVYLADELKRVRAATRRLFNAGYEPRAQDVAALVDLEPSKVVFLWQLDHPVVHLDAPVGDGDSTLGEVLGLRVSLPDPLEVLLHDEALERVSDLLEKTGLVDRRAPEILALRFGLTTQEPMTLEAIGARFGVTRERIRQIEKKAMDFLRGGIDAREARDLLESVTQ